MFGPFEFTEGRYNFTLYDIINKEFEIQKEAASRGMVIPTWPSSTSTHLTINRRHSHH